MKKIIVLLMALLMTCSLFACGESAPSTQNTDSNSVQGTDDSSKNNATEEISEVTEAIVRAYKTAPASDFEYKVDGDGIKINKYVGSDSIVVIPDKIDGKPVTQLKSYLFANDSAVKGVLVPETVLSLAYTFGNNDDIQVVICEGVESLGKLTFGNCASLHTVILGENLSQMDEFCVATCPNLLEVYIGPKVTSIAQNYDSYDVFLNCPKLTVVGEAGSYIQTYAESNGINFRAK